MRYIKLYILLTYLPRTGTAPQEWPIWYIDHGHNTLRFPIAINGLEFSIIFCKRQTATKTGKPLAQTFVTQSNLALPGTMQINSGTVPAIPSGTRVTTITNWPSDLLFGAGYKCSYLLTAP